MAMLGSRHRSVDRWKGAGRSLLAAASLSLAFAAAPARADVPYETKIVGIDDKQLLAELNGISQLVTLQDKPPLSEAALRRRAAEDLPRLKPVLESQGYWEGKIDFSIDLNAKPAQVTLSVDPGPVYRLTQVSLVTRDGRQPPDVAGLDPSIFG